MDTLKNKNYKFNLITEKWIKVLTKKGNDFYSLLEVFENAEDILSLENEDKYIDYSIYRILLAIFLTAYNRNEETKLKNYSKKVPGSDEDADFEYRLDVIKDYLLNQEDEQGVKIYDLFDIYDKDRPFLQMTPERHKNSSVKKVWDEIVEENSASKNGQVFKPFALPYSVLCENSESEKKSGDDIQKLAITYRDKSEFSRIQFISDDWIARNLINYYYFHPNINNGGHPMIYVQDKNIESVLFFGRNLIDFFRLQYQMSLNSKNKLYPVWEINKETEFNTNNTEYLIDQKKNQKIKYYNSLLNNDVIDLPRLLTYSNIILYIDRGNNKFYREPNIPNNIMVNEKEYRICYLNKLQYIKSQKKKERINDIKSFLNIDEGNYRYISTLKFPSYKDFDTCVKELFNEEIILGNSIVKVDSIKEEYKNLEEEVTLEKRKKEEILNWFNEVEKIFKIKKGLKDILNDNCKDEIRILLNYKENEPYNKSRKKNLEEKYEKRRREYINNIDNVIKDKIYSFCLSYIYEYDLREIRKRYGKEANDLEKYIKVLCDITEQEFNRRYLKNRSYGIAGLLKNKKQEKNQ